MVDLTARASKTFNSYWSKTCKNNEVNERPTDKSQRVATHLK